MSATQVSERRPPLRIPSAGPDAPWPRRLGTFLMPHAHGRFAALDGYRAIASLGVVVYHVAGYSGLTQGDAVSARFLNNLGNFGVAVFFLLSGFLLYRPWVLTWFKGDLPPRTFVYYRHRFLRILPAYWVALTAFIAMGLLSAKDPKPDYFVTLFTLTQNYRDAFGFAGLSVAWTLCIEVAFYLAVPLIAAGIRLLGRTATNPRMKLEAQLLGLAIMVVVSLGYRFIIAGPWTNDPVNHKFTVAHLWLPNYLDWFALGMLFAVAVSWKDIGRGLPKLVQRFADTGWACWIVAFACYGILMMTRDASAIVGIAAEKETTVDMGVRFLFNGLAAFFFLLPAVLGRQAGSRIVQVLSTVPFLFLGTISYGIYLWHKVWLDKLKVGHDTIATRYSFVAMLALVLVLTITTASLSYYLLERPLMKFRDPKHLRDRAKTTS